jgi:hypothetical protein
LQTALFIIISLIPTSIDIFVEFVS